jgi:hypothetical protein
MISYSYLTFLSLNMHSYIYTLILTVSLDDSLLWTRLLLRTFLRRCQFLWYVTLT